LNISRSLGGAPVLVFTPRIHSCCSHLLFTGGVWPRDSRWAHVGSHRDGDPPERRDVRRDAGAIKRLRALPSFLL